MGRLRLPPVIMQFLPWAVLLMLLILNGVQGYWALKKAPAASDGLWSGPLMPGKPLAMASRPKKVEPVVEEKKLPFQDEPLRDMVVKPTDEPEPVVEKPLDKVTDKTAPLPNKKPLAKPVAQPVPTAPAKPKPVVAEPRLESGYIVQAGDFVLKLGTDTLLKRLRDHGMEPFVEKEVEMVLLNSVQAGPYPTLEAAKETEVKMKAAGMEAVVSDTWEGHVVTLGKFYLLGYAMQSMESAERMNIKPVRMIKVEVPLEVQKVYLGPFSTRDKAKELSARIAQLGLAVPVIKEWKAKERNGAAANGSKVDSEGKLATDHPMPERELEHSGKPQGKPAKSP
ncbi:MAG: SPOR domain-containing protein [Magnetococcales bacterium]|nr:SPOR domain-containing protein [Magnetococcales bacterium]